MPSRAAAVVASPAQPRRGHSHFLPAISPSSRGKLRSLGGRDGRSRSGGLCRQPNPGAELGNSPSPRLSFRGWFPVWGSPPEGCRSPNKRPPAGPAPPAAGVPSRPGAGAGAGRGLPAAGDSVRGFLALTPTTPRHFLVLRGRKRLGATAQPCRRLGAGSACPQPPGRCRPTPPGPCPGAAGPARTGAAEGTGPAAVPRPCPGSRRFARPPRSSPGALCPAAPQLRGPFPGSTGAGAAAPLPTGPLPPRPS